MNIGPDRIRRLPPIFGDLPPIFETLAGTTDEHSLDRAERIKAGRNEGNIPAPTDLESFHILQVPLDTVNSNFHAIGISLGKTSSDLDNSLKVLKRSEQNQVKQRKNERKT